MTEPKVGAPLLSAHLAIYESLRTEQLKRIESQNRAVNYLLICCLVNFLFFGHEMAIY